MLLEIDCFKLLTNFDPGAAPSSPCLQYFGSFVNVSNGKLSANLINTEVEGDSVVTFKFSDFPS